MSRSDGKGYYVERFVMIDGLDSKQAEAIKNSTTPVVRIPLLQNQKIHYGPAEEYTVTITNRATHTTDIVVFGNSIMYNKRDVEVVTGYA